ncbi:MAG: hypothetical protein MI861_07990 [Pirellulales bacterium]|nr:hypothetical protein [Pirellulales bacterium]
MSRIVTAFQIAWTALKALLGKPASPAVPSVSNRRLEVQSLESRRVLATVTGFTPNDSGFSVQLSEEVSTVNLSLYDTESSAMGAADVTLRGSTVGDVTGSLIVEGTTITFIASGGPLAPDTYTATLRSSSDALIDLADGDLLDGENEGSFPSGSSGTSEGSSSSAAQ